MGMFIEFGIVFFKYYFEWLMEYFKFFWSRMNLFKMICVCEEVNFWFELVFCYYYYDEFDNVVFVVMEWLENFWEYQQFKEIIVKVVNFEIYYKVINFYFEQYFLFFIDFFQVFIFCIDVNCVVCMFQKFDNLFLIKLFLFSVQLQNKCIVNDVINDFLIEEEDYKIFCDFVENYDNYDVVEFVGCFEKYDFVFFC